MSLRKTILHTLVLPSMSFFCKSNGVIATVTNQNVAVKANFVTSGNWQCAMARELLNANGISKSKLLVLARFVPDALKQIEPFHYSVLLLRETKSIGVEFKLNKSIKT